MKKNLSQLSGYAKRRTTPQPLESFDPRYKETLLKGLLEPFSIQFPSRNAAKRFQVRCHQYRSALNASFPEEASILYRVKVSVTDAVVTVRPADQEFSHVFETLGIEETSHERNSKKSLEIPEPSSTEEITPVSFDELLTSIEEKKEENS